MRLIATPSGELYMNGKKITSFEYDLCTQIDVAVGRALRNKELNEPNNLHQIRLNRLTH